MEGFSPLEAVILVVEVLLLRILKGELLRDGASLLLGVSVFYVVLRTSSAD